MEVKPILFNYQLKSIVDLSLVVGCCNRWFHDNHGDQARINRWRSMCEHACVISFGFSDRIRTSINVLGDSYGAGIVYHLCKDELQQQDEEREQQEKVRKASAVDGRLIQLEHAIVDMEMAGRRFSAAPAGLGQ